MSSVQSPVQVRADVVANHAAGVYRRLTLRAPDIASSAGPGHFVACAVGDEGSALLLRRAFSLHRTDRWAGTVDIVVAAHGAGTRWLAARRAGDVLDTVGPLGRPFTMPHSRTSTLLVGGGYGTAPLGWLASTLREKGCRADMVVGAADESRLFGQVDAGAVADSVTVTTDDGSAGTRGRVTDVMPALLERHGSTVAYACGPMAMLRAVHEVCSAHGVATQLAVEESMACGVGVCMTCVLPVRDEGGVTRMVRSCVEGPVFSGAALRWDAIGAGGSRVPDDAYGAPAPVQAVTAPTAPRGTSTGGPS
jgi:dihydroorotate dehydrogenase electron transfer subunit